MLGVVLAATFEAVVEEYQPWVVHVPGAIVYQEADAAGALRVGAQRAGCA